MLKWHGGLNSYGSLNSEDADSNQDFFFSELEIMKAMYYFFFPFVKSRCLLFKFQKMFKKRNTASTLEFLILGLAHRGLWFLFVACEYSKRPKRSSARRGGCNRRLLNFLMTTATELNTTICFLEARVNLWICCGAILSLVQILFSFVENSLSYIIINYHTPRQRKIKFAPRTKLHHNKYSRSSGWGGASEKREPGDEVVFYLVLNVFIKLYEKAGCEILIFPTEILKNRAGYLPDMNRLAQ